MLADFPDWPVAGRDLEEKFRSCVRKAWSDVAQRQVLQLASKVVALPDISALGAAQRTTMADRYVTTASGGPRCRDNIHRHDFESLLSLPHIVGVLLCQPQAGFAATRDP